MKLLEMRGLGQKALLYPISFLSGLLEGWNGVEDGNIMGEIVNQNLAKVGKLVPAGATNCDTWVMTH